MKVNLCIKNFGYLYTHGEIPSKAGLIYKKNYEIMFFFPSRLHNMLFI